MGNLNKIKMPARSNAAPKKTITRRRRRTETFSVYIFRVLRQVHEKTGISKRSMSIMNSFINDLFERISAEAGRLVRYCVSSGLDTGGGGMGTIPSGPTD